MKNEKKSDRILKIVANINFIQDSFNKKSFNSNELKAKCKTLKVPHAEDFLKGLIEKNKVVKESKDQYKFKDARPIYHFIIEEILETAQEKQAKYQKKYEKKETSESVEISADIPDFSSLENLIAIERIKAVHIIGSTDYKKVEAPTDFTPVYFSLKAALEYVKASGFRVYKQNITLEEI